MSVQLEDGMVFEGGQLLPKLTDEAMVGHVSKVGKTEVVDVYYFGVYLGTAKRAEGEEWGWGDE